MKLLVVGAGVLGSLYASKLHLAGHQVTVLARGKRLTDLREYGIVLENSSTGRQMTVRPPIIEALSPNERYDAALILVRKNQVTDLLPALAKNTATPSFVFMLNNATGSDAMAAALGRERVLLGFPGAGGALVGHIVRYRQLEKGSQPTTLGELDGSTTPRLRQIANALQSAGFPVAISPNIDAWLKTHVALVSPIANTIYMMGGSLRKMLHTPDAMLILVRAIREGMAVLRKLEVPVTPWKYSVLLALPEQLLVSVFCRIWDSEAAVLVMERHANHARDEMEHLANEFRSLIDLAGLPTPCIDRLAAHLNPDTAPMPAGTHTLPTDWGFLRMPLATSIGLLLVAAAAQRARKSIFALSGRHQ
jgi:2-dehydropantoate 2-reductase